MIHTRIPRTVALLLGAAVAGGCATKRDVRDLRSQISMLEARQDSLARVSEAHQRMLLDSISAGTDLLVRVRGDLGHQLLDLEQQLIQIQALVGQSQRRLQDLGQQMEANRERLQQPPPGDTTAATPPGVAPPPGGTPSAAELYQLGTDQLQKGAAGTARKALQTLLKYYPNDAHAADAQFDVGETYVLDQMYDSAYSAFDQVVELYPSSPRAPAALLRAGEVAEEHGSAKKARDYYERVRARYPKSDEAGTAATKLRHLKR